MAWKVDPKLSKIEFQVKHLKVTTVRGQFANFEGTLHMDEETPPASQVEGIVEGASVNTGLGLRDLSLKAASFFDVKQFPHMHFRSTEIGPFEGDDRFKVHGDLTIRDVTRPVVFHVEDKGELPPVAGRRRRAFEASLVLNRKDYDLKWPLLQELGGLLVEDRVEGVLDIHLLEE